MNDRIIKLPLKPTILKTWPNENFFLSIIQTKKTGFDWCMTYFTQVYVLPYTERFDKKPTLTFSPSTMYHKHTSISQFCPFIKQYMIPNELIERNYESFIKLIENCIDNNFYLAIKLDQFFRDNNIAQRWFHANYIWGYNQDSKVFYAIDNFENNDYIGATYKPFTITYEDIYKSFLSICENQKIDITLYRVVDYDYKFDLKLFVQFLDDYLNATNHLKTLSLDNNDNALWGMDYYDAIYSYLTYIKENTFDIDMRIFTFLQDIRVMMNLRLNYLKEHHFLKPDTKLIEKHNFLIISNDKLELLAIKYSLKKDLAIIDRLITTLKEIEIYEHNFIKELLTELVE